MHILSSFFLWLATSLVGVTVSGGVITRGSQDTSAFMNAFDIAGNNLLGTLIWLGPVILLFIVVVYIFNKFIR